MFRTLVTKVNKHKIRALNIVEFFLKCRCLKWFRIIHLDLICINYDQKKDWDSKSQIVFGIKDK